MTIRKLHRTVALIFAPFFVITATTGAIMLLRMNGLYSGQTMNVLIGLHNWELVANHIGIILASGLLFVTVTGVMIWGQIRLHRRRSKAE